MKKFLIILFIIMLCCCFVSCTSAEDEDVVVDEFTELYKLYVVYAESRNSSVLTYQDWLKTVKGEKGADGQDGRDGVSPELSIGENGNWYINGVDTNVSALSRKGDKGDKGDDGENGSSGVGISNARVTDDGILEIQYSNDSQYVSIGNVKGKDGINGTNGTNGQNGVGISDLRISDEGMLEIKYSNSNEYISLGKVKGEDGTDGEDGTNGKDGESIFQTFLTENPEYSKSESEFISEFFTLNTQGLKFYLQDDGTYSVAGGDAVYLSKIIIPKSYNGIAVTKIVENGFYNFENLKEIILPETIVEIGAKAFYDCEQLESVNIPTNIKSVYIDSFYGCDNLNYYEYENGFYLGNDANKYIILISIKDNADKVIVHQDCLFCFALFDNSIVDLTIPNSIVKENLLINCTNLQSLSVGLSSDILSKLFGRKSTEILIGGISYPTEIANIPNSLKTIKFTSGEKLGSELIGFDNLENIYLPKSLKKISKGAFSTCISLNNVYYCGSENDWNSVEKNEVYDIIFLGE